MLRDAYIALFLWIDDTGTYLPVDLSGMPGTSPIRVKIQRLLYTHPPYMSVIINLALLAPELEPPP